MRTKAEKREGVCVCVRERERHKKRQSMLTDGYKQGLGEYKLEVVIADF
jgi:hypothetical protein